MASTTSRAGLPAEPVRRLTRLQWTLAGLIAAAWLTLALWSVSPYANYLDHAYQASGAAEQVAVLALFLTGWTLMITAMMLPATTSLLQSFREVVRRRDRPGALVALVIAGFVLTWVAVGYAFRVGDIAFHGFVASFDWLEQRPELIGGAVLILAGLYQFTPLKNSCLAACRSPRNFIYRHWHGERPGADAFHVGLTYGLSCVGCCWSLMLVMFALGTSSVVWMFGLATLMTIERVTSIGVRLVRPVGVALVAAGVVMAAGAF